MSFMKNITFSLSSILFLLLSSSILAQNLKTKTEKSDFYKYVYTINKETNLKHGAYCEINKTTKDTTTTGFYDNGIKVGRWNFYKNNNLYFSYNYNTKKLEHIDSTLLKPDFYLIRESNNDFTLEKVDTPPILLAKPNEIELTISQNLRLNPEILENNLFGISIISFVINKEGKMQELVIENVIEKNLGKNITKILENTHWQWIPATYKGKPADSKFFIKLDIGDNTIAPVKTLEKPYLIGIVIRYYGIIRSNRTF